MIIYTDYFSVFLIIHIKGSESTNDVISDYIDLDFIKSEPAAASETVGGLLVLKSWTIFG